MPLLSRRRVPSFVRDALRAEVDAGKTVCGLASEVELTEKGLLRLLAGLPCTKRAHDAAVRRWMRSHGSRGEPALRVVLELVAAGHGEQSIASFLAGHAGAA